MNIKCIFFVFLLLSICSSCEKEEPQESIPTQSVIFSNLEVTVIECDDIACANATFLSGVTITLFQTENDAKEFIGPINDGQSDVEGVVFFSSLTAYDGVFIRVDYNDQVYISYNSLGADITAYHEAIFVTGFSYDFDDSLERDQAHISLNIPQVGQRSVYQYYHKEEYDLVIPELDTVSLVVRIDEKISENIFIVSEHMSSQPEEGFRDLPEGVLLNYWEFKGDSLIITSYDNSEIKSCLFGFGDYYFPPSRLSLALNSPLVNKLDFDDPDLILGPLGSSLGPSFQPYYMFVEDVNFIGTNYDLLQVRVMNNMAADGDLKVLMYNQEDAFVRFLVFDFWLGGSYSWVLVKD